MCVTKPLHFNWILLRLATIPFRWFLFYYLIFLLKIARIHIAHGDVSINGNFLGKAVKLLKKHRKWSSTMTFKCHKGLIPRQREFLIFSTLQRTPTSSNTNYLFAEFNSILKHTESLKIPGVNVWHRKLIFFWITRYNQILFDINYRYLNSITLCFFQLS